MLVWLTSLAPGNLSLFEKGLLVNSSIHCMTDITHRFYVWMPWVPMVPRVPWVPEVMVYVGTMGTLCTRGTGGGGLYGYDGYLSYHGYRRWWFIWVTCVHWLQNMVVYIDWRYLLGLVFEHCFRTLLNFRQKDFPWRHLIVGTTRTMCTMGTRGTAGGG